MPFQQPQIPAEAVVNTQITDEAKKHIHQLAVKYGNFDGLEDEMRTLYTLERQMEYIDNATNPTHSYDFAQRAKAHFEIAKVESVVVHNIEDIFSKAGKSEEERSKLAKNITRLMVSLAWNDSI